MSKIDTQTFYQLSAEDALLQLNATPQGLSSQEVAIRQKELGLNELPSGPKISPLKLFLGQFKDVLIIILIIAATVSLGVSFIEHEGSITESLLIYGIVFAIALVGFFNEYKAEKTVEALRGLLSQNCRVRRDGKEIEIPVNQLVPGDVVLLDEGKKIPADMRLLQAHRLQVNEASLTGESVPVSKKIDQISSEAALADRKNMVFSGTLVTTGTAEAVVVATGAQTQIGNIAKLVSEVEQEDTPMQRKLDDLGKKLGLVIMVICALVFVVIFFLDRDAMTLDFVQRMIFAFTAAIALAVAAIPEGLAFVVRISLALGARRMAARNALVRKLSAVESLGSTDVICSDKTGTLTRGEMTVRKLFASGKTYDVTGSGYEVNGEIQLAGKKVENTADIQRLLEIGVLNNNAQVQNNQVLGDPTEGCLWISAAKAGIDASRLIHSLERIEEIPFSSDRKMMTTIHRQDKGVYIAVKGAPDVLIDKCNKVLIDGHARAMGASEKKQILQAMEAMASDALRVLAFAHKEATDLPDTDEDAESDLIFVGLQGMMDPPRTEVAEVIKRVQVEAGMKVIMITGDNSQTAQAVAREIGIEGDVMTGLELEALSQEELNEKVESIGVYARVNPEHKIKIVRALQHNGHQVAMTGDGVNDAPAIKAADVGIAMGITGTDASKEAADMILLDDRFLTIISAIEEGRGIFDNVRKFVNFLLSCNIGEVIIVLLGILVHGNLVVTAAQLLFINIVTDGLPAIALGSDPASKNVMKFKPNRFQQSIITPRLWTEIVVYGVLMSAVMLFQYTINLEANGALVASSCVFVAMVVFEFARLIDIRTDYKIKWFSNPWLSISIVVSLLIQIAVVYTPPLANLFNVTPINPINWVIIIVGSLALFVIMKLLNPLFDRIGPENADHHKA